MNWVEYFVFTGHQLLECFPNNPAKYENIELILKYIIKKINIFKYIFIYK